jgi:hypothetical protein
MRIEVVELCKSQIIVSPAIRANLDDPILWQVLSKPVRDKNLACKDEEGWDNAPRRADALY